MSTRKNSTRKEKAKQAIKELQLNHNWSWATEIDYRNQNDLDYAIIDYRGKKISYRDFMKKSDEMARSLKANGFKKGDEIPVCMSNSPEFIMLLRAISVIGAKINVFGADFDPDYIAEIINKSKATMLFVTDDVYEELKPALELANVEKITMFSLAESLPNGKDPFIEIDKHFYHFENLVDNYKSENSKIISSKEFLETGLSYEGQVKEETTLDDEFIISYTSGSTNSGRPKAIVHTNSSLIYMGRFHDPDLSGLPATRHIRNLAQIPTHSNTGIITSISDSIMQNCTVCPEPIYNPEFFIYSLIINKPHFAPATRSFYVQMCKMYNNEPQFKNVKFENLYIPTIVGEPNTPGEEKFINATLKKAKAGTKAIPRPVSPVVMSVGGGDCEHGGIYFTLYRVYMELLNKVRLGKEKLGLLPFNGLIETVALDENGNVLKPGECGILAADSPCTMKCYKDNPEATEQFYVTDANGRKRANLNVYGYVDKYGSVHMKGRADNYIPLVDGTEVPFFVVSDLIAKDTKNILSVEIVKVDNVYVAHIETYPGKNVNAYKLLGSIAGRIANEIGSGVLEQLVFNFRNGYPLTGCGKRSNNALIAEGLTPQMTHVELCQDGMRLSFPYAQIQRSRIREFGD